MTTTSAQPCASDGTGKTLRDTQTAETQITQDVQRVTHRRKTMIIRQIKPRWYRLDTDGLVFFGYSREHVRHKLEAWVREHDLKAMR
jgi:hypothetical protein